ncbi:iron-siderophore ABC transporter substrate-binding protein [Thalassospira sp.]|uniref:iron-siderophore ABC transporter substrate-binding protein n=1 Tax=Thalassospira sp. TaxID=1912094 RepID=UPI0027376478|nr:iron-siderophore ABC transporter substrate-binding protein [Thalassospira sp.]MDP2696974.1 iron-siderophore ABC transporter substrate-binding protein [Thalassospira sp.]
MQKHWIGRITLVCTIAFGSLFALPAGAETFDHELGQAEFQTTPTRFAVTNWSLVESLLALGVAPVAIPEADGYRIWVVEPSLPEQFTDLGTRREPNFEALRESRPDAILISSEISMAYDKLSAFAPTLAYSIYNTDEPAIDRAEALMRYLGKLTGKEHEAETVIKSANDRIAVAAERIRQTVGDDKKFAIVRILDESHFRIHGEKSLFGSTLIRMGFENTWQGEVNSWAFYNGEVSDLAKMGDVQFAYIEPIAPTTKVKLLDTALWKTMPFVRNNQVYAVPSSWTFGGLMSAVRFAEQLADTITAVHGS